ncbi:hypothetical protein [Magnetospirillum aberrantis]|uniref:DUF5320 domain-containing protein n=1 Tax=Magnetospirillum aberrantis SpK TaxID=908842 RepID=A0A7C9UUW8_9PROT|nr:hypothetical protein [Magnetospirillum aberrantis]NFV79609.1 hypothetical protein [Magnetospirillum aberrantis SpK]
MTDFEEIPPRARFAEQEGWGRGRRGRMRNRGQGQGLGNCRRMGACAPAEDLAAEREALKRRLAYLDQMLAETATPTQPE